MSFLLGGMYRWRDHEWTFELLGLWIQNNVENDIGLKELLGLGKYCFFRQKTIYLLGNADIVDNELASTPSGFGRSSDGKCSEGNSLHAADSGLNSGCLSGYQEPYLGCLSGRKGSQSGYFCGQQDSELGCLSER